MYGAPDAHPIGSRSQGVELLPDDRFVYAQQADLIRGDDVLPRRRAGPRDLRPVRREVVEDGFVILPPLLEERQEARKCVLNPVSRVGHGQLEYLLLEVFVGGAESDPGGVGFLRHGGKLALVEVRGLLEFLGERRREGQ